MGEYACWEPRERSGARGQIRSFLGFVRESGYRIGKPEDWEGNSLVHGGMVGIFRLLCSWLLLDVMIASSS